ncbi:hypothetical protein LXL04_015890 [Taraxacum kok-saghyz]
MGDDEYEDASDEILILESPPLTDPTTINPLGKWVRVRRWNYPELLTKQAEVKPLNLKAKFLISLSWLWLILVRLIISFPVASSLFWVSFPPRFLGFKSNCEMDMSFPLPTYVAKCNSSSGCVDST